MKISSLILAKSQSKRLTNKNLLDFLGKPMFVWNLRKCRGVFGEVYISSDSDEILKIARRYGAKTIKRPDNLCGEVPNIPVYQHALEFMERPNVIVAVQACSPTMETGLLEITRDIMFSGCKELMTCHPVESKKDYHSQTFPIYGSIWAISKERLENYGDPYKPNPEVLLVDESVDIHNKRDFNRALKRMTTLK